MVVDFPVGIFSNCKKKINVAASGGTILVSAAVEEVIIEKILLWVFMKDGKLFRAANIVNNAGIMTTTSCCH
jgi:hypothetical protein